MRHTLLRLGLAAALIVPALSSVPSHAAGGCMVTNPATQSTPVTSPTSRTCQYVATDLGRFQTVADGLWSITKTYKQGTVNKTDTIATGYGPAHGILSTKAGDVVKVTLDAGATGIVNAGDI